MKIVPVKESVGMTLCHDITRIVPGQFKGAAFKKGKVIEAGDIPKLLDLGKENIYVFDLKDGYIHENEAARRISGAAAGPGILLSKPSEGRVNLKSETSGLLKVNVRGLLRINGIEEIVFSTMHTNQIVAPGKAVAGARIIPLCAREEKIVRVEEICAGNFPIIEIKPFKAMKAGMVTTGSEVYNGRIQDKFGPVIKRKFEELGSRITRQIFVSDSVEMAVDAISTLINEGAEIIAVTGGMSVDPDDQTPAAIRAAGGDVIFYGAPVFPGAMFMLAYIGDIPVMGLPGCVMYYRASIFDLVAPRIMAGEKPVRSEIVGLGHGGFCAGCKECRYPLCPFGKGGLE